MALLFSVNSVTKAPDRCIGLIAAKVKLQGNGLGDVDNPACDAARQVQMPAAGRGKGHAKARTHRRQHGLHRIKLCHCFWRKTGAQAGADNLIE